MAMEVKPVEELQLCYILYTQQTKLLEIKGDFERHVVASSPLEEPGLSQCIPSIFSLKRSKDRRRLRKRYTFFCLRLSSLEHLFAFLIRKMFMSPPTVGVGAAKSS